LGRPINDNQVRGNEDFEDENIEYEEDADYNGLLDEAQGRGQEKRIFLMNHLAHLWCAMKHACSDLLLFSLLILKWLILFIVW